MPRSSRVTVLLLALGLVGVLASQGLGQGPGNDEAKVRNGLAIAPVPLDLRGKNRALVGLGSYIVNAQADCGGCHSNPLYAQGGDPHLGQPAEINQDTYLAGGGDLFGPFVPRNLTPNASGEPAGLSLDEFIETMRTGRDLKNRPPHVPTDDNDLLQVMPWPIFSKMSDKELKAIYEYLSAIPCLPSENNPTRCD